MMTINEAPLNQNLTVSCFGLYEMKEISDIESRLMHMGFLEGAIIRVTKRVPFFQGPILVDVRGRLIALSESEAKLVTVEVVK